MKKQTRISCVEDFDTYNSVGQRTTQADQNNNQFSYVFDNLHRLTEVNVVPGAGVGGTTQQVFVYDNMSRLTNAKDITPAVTNEVARNYNILGRLTSETQKIGTTTIKTIAKEYNLVGRVSKLTYPNGRINDYTFDNNYLPNTIVSNSTTVATYTFNGVNAPVTKAMGNTVSLNIEYNNRYQITKHDWKKSGVTIAGYNYGHDSVGNRIWSENLVTANKSELFAFDNADRLTNFKTGTLNGTKTAITTQTYSQIWTLDSIGNWSGFNDNGSNSTNTFSDTHEMTQFKGVTNTFDNNGNLIFDGVRSFKYDAFNRIIEVKVGAVILAEYQYDAFNRRVMKKVDADLNSSFETVSKSLYDGFRCIEELNASDALVKEFVYGSLYIDEVILQRAGASDYYFTHDYRYSVTSLTNSAGTIVENYDYKVYGERTITGSGLTDIGYTGQRHDSETGLMYFKNRYYSTSMGSFVTRDPLGYVDGASMYLGYFGGHETDPLGLFQSDGHFYTTYLIAVAAGINQKDADELAYYSQLPDERTSFDAIGTIQRQAQFLFLNKKRNQWRRDIQNYLHSLHGGDIKARRECLKKLIKRKDLDNKVKGLLIHAFADTFSHTHEDEKGDLKAYHTGKGHASDGTRPDVIPVNKEKWKELANELYDALGGAENGNSSLRNEIFKNVDNVSVRKNEINSKFPEGTSSDSKNAFFDLMKTDKFSGDIKVGLDLIDSSKKGRGEKFIEEKFNFDKKIYDSIEKVNVKKVIELMKKECPCLE